jgi:PAS domain S-box-containing protein
MGNNLRTKKQDVAPAASPPQDGNRPTEGDADEQLFERIFKLSPLRMGLLRIKDGVILNVNDQVVHDIEYTKEELIGRSILEFDEVVASEWSERIKNLLEASKPFRNVEGRVFTKSGEERFVVTSAEVVKVRGDKCFLWATIDITERKRAEDALHRNEELFRAIVEDQSEMIVRWRPDGIRTFVNEAYARVFGGRPEDFIGTSFLPLVAEEYRPAIREKIKSLTPENPLATAIHESVAGNGERRWQEWTDRGIFDDQGQLVELQSTGRDITERKLAEDSLRTSQEQLRALSARLRSAREEEGTRIAREIHDELGSALTGLRWDLERLDKTLAAPHGAGVEPARQKIAAMANLIDSTIDTVRRISSELRPGALDDLGLVAAIEWQVQQFKQRTRIKVECDCAQEVSLTGDRAVAVFRIFQEILTNVLRHAQATCVRVWTSVEAGEFVLEVQDNGRGITWEQQHDLSSLGLMGMSERAHLIGGEVSITGVEGKGTSVVVRVPLD